MLKNYFKIAFRNLTRNKLHTVIVLIGLCTGITSCLLIALFVKHEKSYESFHAKADRTARVIMKYSIGGEVNGGNYTSLYVGPSFKKSFPEIETFVRLSGTQRVVKYKEKLVVEKRFIYSDSTFFKIFSYRLVKGSPDDALSGPNKLVITESMAKKYFDTEDPLGKVMKISSAGTDYVVSGVVEDCPSNSHIKFDFLASLASFGPMINTEKTYWNANYITYFLLNTSEQINTLDDKIPGFMKSEMGDLTPGDYVTYELEPIKGIHLHSQYNGFEPNGSSTYVYAVISVGLLILIIACFTYVNLSTAKSSERAREIGIRKAAGAYRSQLFIQFISESFLLSSIALVISLLLTILLLPAFCNLTGRPLEASGLASTELILLTLVILIGTGFFSGLYPALILSSFEPVLVLKGAFKNTSSGLLLRKTLFALQFVISVFLIIATFIIQRQLSYFQNKDLGFSKEMVITLGYDSKIHEQFNVFKERLKKLSSVKFVARGDFKPTEIVGGYNMHKPGMAQGTSFGVTAGTIDEEYLDACGIKIIAGSNLTEQDMKAVSGDNYEQYYYHFILNESAARQLGWKPEEAVGKKMFLDETRPGEVRAVVKDFHFSSLHNPIKPMVLFPMNYGHIILVKLNKGNPETVISQIEGVWKSVFTHRPFEFTFLNDDYNALYKSEIQLNKSMLIFSILAILLAMLGLFGLASYTIKQKAKEISIRKIMGMPVHAIVLHLSKNFIWLIGISSLIAIPLAWITMNRWLQNFNYRIDLEVWYFALPGLGLILLAFLTISIKAVTAARENPIKNLRTE